MSDDLTKNDAQVIVDTALAAATPNELDADKLYAAIVPVGSRVELLDLDKYRSAPTRKAGTYRPATLDSFVSYVKTNLTDATTIWLHPTSGKIVAVLDDHHAEGPDWRQHKVELKLEHTPEWTYWVSQDGHMMGQEAFAEHIEGGLEEIKEPAAADVLEMAQSFHATVGSTFRSSTRLASGEQQFQYEEEVRATAGAKGDLTVPTMILLGISPFVGEDPYSLAARFRFRLSQGKLTLGYKLDRPESVIRDCIDKIEETLTKEFAEKCQVYVGDAPS